MARANVTVDGKSPYRQIALYKPEVMKTGCAETNEVIIVIMDGAAFP